MKTITILVTLLILSACRFHYEVNWYNDSDIQPVSQARAQQLEQAFERWMNQYELHTAGVGLIIAGELVWEGYYGEQSPGIEANPMTLFNVGSITKTVTTETILRLVAQGQLDLDEPMSTYWLDPDLKDDPRHQSLTARMALSHRTGFLNWRFFADNNQLAFVNDPGSTYGYSGEGTEYLAQYAENKLGQPFEALVQQTILDPLQMSNTSLSNQIKNHKRIAKPYDLDGQFYGYYCRPEGYCAPEGSVSVADDMVITVRDYAKFLNSVMHAEGLDKSLRKERVKISENLVLKQRPDCSLHPATECPQAEGYGLGWYVIEPNGNQLVGHGGSDWSELAQAYYYSGSHDGVIIFINAPVKRALPAMIEALSILDPKSAKIHEYQRWSMLSQK